METGTFIAEIGLTEIDGAPRCRDLELAERLGFDRPRKIRDLIKSNITEMEGFGTCPAVGRVIKGERGSTTAEEFYLNEEQALLVAILSKAPNAAAVRSMLIKVFVAWRRGHFDFDAISPKQFGGIVKAVVHKELSAVLPAMVESAIVADSRRAALNVVSVRQLTEDGGALPKGRNSVNRRIGSALRDLAASDQDGGKAFKCPHTGVWLFDRAFAERFMRDSGATMIRAHNDKVGAQGVLKLVQPKKPNNEQPSKGA